MRPTFFVTAAFAATLIAPLAGCETAREPVGGAGGIAGGVAKRGGGDHVGGGGGDHAPLDETAPTALLDRADEPVRLERPEVVIHLLARQSHAARDARLVRSGPGSW